MGEVSSDRAAEALTDVAGLDLHRHVHLGAQQAHGLATPLALDDDDV
jgi:hypothetical protein